MRMLSYLLKFLVVLLLVRFVVRALALWMRPSAGSAPARPPVPRIPDLVRDRICNTFVPRDRALMAVVGGHEEHFCSPACRDQALGAVAGR